MDNTTIYPVQNPLSKAKPFYLEFRQLKEYYNSRRKFKADKNDTSKQEQIIQHGYYLIDKNWLNEWKLLVGYQKFHEINLNRNVNENDIDYKIFVGCLPPNKRGLKIAPLDNTNIYGKDGQINPFAEFVIINKECLNVFAESRPNKKGEKIEKSCPLKFLKDKIILYINTYTRLICYRDEKTKNDIEIIIKYKNDKNIDKVLSSIEKSNIKSWLENKKFYSNGPDELDIVEQGCSMKIINKNLKLIIAKHKNRVTVKSDITKFFKGELPEELQIKVQYQAQEIFEETRAKFFNQSNNNNKLNQNQNFCQMQNCNNVNQFQNNNNLNNNMNFFNNNMLQFINMNMMNNMNKNMPNINMMMNNNNMARINNMNNFQFSNIPNVNMINRNNQINLDLQKKNNSSPNISAQTPFSQKENIFTSGINYPHQAGLQNIGQSCYMNATIECLSNIKSLSNNLLLKFGSFNPEKQPLCLAYSNLIFRLLHTREKYINPQIFKDVIGKLNPLFEGNQAADAKDLIFFIIETLHKELMPPSINVNNFEIDFFQQEMNSNNENIVFQNFLKELKVNQTIVSNIFYGVFRSVMFCNGCKRNKFSFQTFNLLIFPLKKIKDYKIVKLGGAVNNKNLDLNLYDAFFCEQEVEKLEGENMIYCNFCRKLSPGSHKQDFYTLPPILIIILNRGRNNQDFKESFRFNETLDFSSIVQNQSSWKKYFLCGIITHLGKSGSDGHFIAYCRNNFNDNFTCYNDASVSPVSVSNAMSARVSENEAERKTPYILLYHYMK